MDRPGEDQRPNAETEALLATLRAMQDAAVARQSPRGHARTFHAKTIAGVRAEMRIREDVPEALRHGLFARPATFGAILRFSSARSWPAPDCLADGRGLTVRVFDAPGTPVEGSGPAGQDFLALNGNVRFFRDVVTARRVMPLTHSMMTMPLTLQGKMGLVDQIRMGSDFAAIALKTFRCVAGQDYFCVGPIAIGPGAAKVSFHAGPGARRSSRWRRDGLAESVDARLRQGELTFEVRLQPFVDERSTPIENLARRWDARVSPPVAVADLVLLRRGPEEAGELREIVDRLAFSPWHCIEAHHPVGPIQQARRRAYAESAARRGA